ncbi:MAG: carboxypeptidase regulatory-like domain-containing protein [Gemmatimonadales bacterium]|nr:carboxypeptidase regulatory-like domain-containing protein [Gemmatimonadales bacterium]
MTRTLFTPIAAVLLLSVSGCGGDNQGGQASPPAPPPAAGETPAAGADAQASGGGTITGTITFTGARPANAPIDMSEEAVCKEKYTAGAPPRAETVVGNPGVLANVFVYVKSGLPAGARYTAPTTPVVLDQDGCRYHPHVFGVMVGQMVEIRNSDPVLHNIKAIATKNRPFNISQPAAGMKTNRTFTAPEVMVALECNVHGWMNAFAGVRPDPFFAVSGADGSYGITGLPPGTYTIEAWHERYGTQTASVTVTGTESKTADLTFAAR